ALERDPGLAGAAGQRALGGHLRVPERLPGAGEGPECAAGDAGGGPVRAGRGRGPAGRGGSPALQRKSVLYLSLMMGLSMIFGTLPLMFTINADFEVTSFFLVSLSTVLSGFLASMNGANIRALLLNVNVPEARGAVMSVAN
ncbi:unnamed protein product, partial [Heterosigma akashiwo]